MAITITAGGKNISPLPPQPPETSPSFFKSLTAAAAPVLSTEPVLPWRNAVGVLQERCPLESVTSDDLRSACSSGKNLRVSCGFDPTAESLHLDNLLGFIVLSWLQHCGGKAVALIGGATACVGDPSGKSLGRPELDTEALERNNLGVSNVASRILGRSLGKRDDLFVIKDNYDWWKGMRLLDFLKRVGR